MIRGQRVFCSDRGQRGGCGRSFSIFLADVLPRHTLSASFLWQLLIALLSGVSIRAAFHEIKPPVALESVYHVLQRLRRRLDAIRVRLCGRRKPPKCSHPDPLIHTIEHLKDSFTDSDSPAHAFHLVFQHSLLG